MHLCLLLSPTTSRVTPSWVVRAASTVHARWAKVAEEGGSHGELIPRQMPNKNLQKSAISMGGVPVRTFFPVSLILRPNIFPSLPDQSHPLYSGGPEWAPVRRRMNGCPPATASAKIRVELQYRYITNRQEKVGVGMGKRKSLKDFV